MKESSIDSQKIIRRKRDGELEYLPDDLTIEEPLELRIGRKTLATTMRTPGHDEELAAGFLVSEAIVRARDEIARISADRDNRVIIDLKEGVKLKLNSTKRFGTISSSCGLCGKTNIGAIRQNFPPITSKAIGRHNAVDKAIGRAFLDGRLPLDEHLLLVSGRASLEIIQKALAAGIPIIAAVSAPSTLAVSFARQGNQTLIGFLRPPSFNIYAHVERVILA